MSFNDENLQERIKKAELFLNNQITENRKMLFLMMPVLLIFLICLIYLTWFNFWTFLIIIFVLFCIFGIIGIIGDNLENKKQLKLIYTDIPTLKEVEKIMKDKLWTPKEKLQEKININIKNDTDKLYSVILKSTYGCKMQVVRYFEDEFSLSVLDANTLIEKIPTIIIEYVDLERASQIQKDLIALGAGCVVEKFNPNRTDVELKDKYTDNLLHCPRCGSTSVAIGERGWKITTGFIGSSKTTNRCGKCGYSWQPK